MERVRFEKKTGPEREKAKKQETLPPVDFASLVLSLAASAQMHLGLIPSPEGKKEEKNILLAKQTIDLLGVLEEKTKGNLTEDEQRLFTEILHALRLQFVEANQNAP